MKQEISKFADIAMYQSEEMPDNTKSAPKVYLLNMTRDPLGSIAAACQMYEGKVIRDLSQVTDEQRKRYFEQVQKTHLQAPFEFVDFHFMIEGVTRAFTHQIVRQRTACLSGDTEIYTERKDRRRTIAQLYDQWNKGGNLRGPLSRIKIRTVTDEGMIVYRTIGAVYQNGIKDVWEVKTHDGKTIKTTEDHLLWRPNKEWSELQDLKVGDEIVANGVELVKDEKWLHDKIEQGLNYAQIARLSNCSKPTIKKYCIRYNLFPKSNVDLAADETWLKQKVSEGFSTKQIAELADCSTSHVKKYRRVYDIHGQGGVPVGFKHSEESKMNMRGPKPKWSEEAKQKFSKWCLENRGGKNPENYSGMDPGHRVAQVLFNHLKEKGCAWCGENHGRMQLAHLDGNPMNNKPGNVQAMCNPCHHAMDTGSLPRKTYPTKIVSISYIGKEMTYDIEMNGEYHRFVANGLVVHNCYAQESLRFAVKNNLREEVRLPPSLANTTYDAEELDEDSYTLASNEQRMRMDWEHAIDQMEQMYHKLIDKGMPAEDARGLLPHSVTTRLHYKTNLRGLLEHLGNRLCTQAQFEWRSVASGIVQAIREFPCEKEFRWQQETLSEIFRPVCYQLGHCAFMADFDRYCSIRDRVEEHHKKGEPSTIWLDIHPSEWLNNPTGAREKRNDL